MRKTEAELRTELINWILKMKDEYQQPLYARQALKDYARAMPWLDLKAGVKAAMGQPGQEAE